MRNILLGLFIMILYLTCLFFYTNSYKFQKKKKQKECFSIFSDMYPLSPLCPGKTNSTICYDCPYNMDNHDYKIDKLSKDEVDIKKF